MLLRRAPGQHLNVHGLSPGIANLRQIFIQLVRIIPGRHVLVSALIAGGIGDGIVHLLNIGGLVPPRRLDTMPGDEKRS